MDGDALAERILLDLKNTFKKDPLIDEFDILPVSESHRNTSPVIHVDHKVALEDWCIKHVYVYAYSKFFSWRKKPYKVDTGSLLMWSSAILLINPEPETVWNARKELVCQNVALPENELKFSELVLSRKPKSAPVYAHRKWVLLELMKSNPSSCTIRQLVDHEIHLCTRFANLYPNNYYAWCHRSWVLTQIDGPQHKTVSDELERTEKWASTHVSDHCGFHYRQFLLSCLPTSNKEQFSHASAPNTSGNAQSYPCPSSEASTVLNNCSVQSHLNGAMKKELELLGDLQATYPGHEALWYHRRYILHKLHKLGAISLQGNVRPGDIGPGNLGSSAQNIQIWPRTNSPLKIQSSSGKVACVDTSEHNLECTSEESHQLSSKAVAHVQSHIEEIHSFGVSVEAPGHCKIDSADAGQDIGSDERGTVSSIGDIHSLVLEDAGPAEGHAQCKRCKVDGDGAEQEQVEGPIRGNDFEDVCSMDSETGEVHSRTPPECKRCKLDCASTAGQEPRPEQSGTDDMINSCPGGIDNRRTHDSGSAMEVSTHGKNPTSSDLNAQTTTNAKYKASNLEVWSRLEEECFLEQLLAKSREGRAACCQEWELALLKRHICWMSRTLRILVLSNLW